MVAELFHAIVIIGKSQRMGKNLFLIQQSGNNFMATIIYTFVILREIAFDRLYNLCVTNAISSSFVGKPAAHFHSQLRPKYLINVCHALHFIFGKSF